MLNNKGFTLVELMVATAIAAGLAAVAVPSYQKYTFKAKQAEVKVNLASIYEAQTVFKLQHNTYYPNLVATGYEPEGEMLYEHGFRSYSGILVPSSFNTLLSQFSPAWYRNSTSICSTTFGGGYSQNCVFSGEDVSLETDHRLTRTTFTAGSKGFPAALAGKGKKSSGNSDIWTMNERKELVNTDRPEG